MAPSFITWSSPAWLYTDFAVEQVTSMLRRDVLTMVHPGGISFVFHLTPFSTVQPYNSKRQLPCIGNNHRNPISPISHTLSMSYLTPPTTPRGRVIEDVDFEEQNAFEISNIVFDNSFVAIVLVVEDQTVRGEWIKSVRNNIELSIMDQFGPSLFKHKQRRIIFTERKRASTSINKNSKRHSRTASTMLCECSGWLIRKELSSHKSRLVFCLAAEDELQFFKDSELRELIASIALTHGTFLSLIEGSNFAFQVKDQNLAAFCEDDRRKWVRTVSERIQRIQVWQQDSLPEEPEQDRRSGGTEERVSNNTDDDERSISIYSDIEIFTADDELSFAEQDSDVLSGEIYSPEKITTGTTAPEEHRMRKHSQLRIDLNHIVGEGNRNSAEAKPESARQESGEQSPTGRVARMFSRIWSRNRSSTSNAGKKTLESTVNPNQHDLEQLTAELQQMKSRLSTIDSRYSQMLIDKQMAIDQLSQENALLRARIGADTDCRLHDRPPHVVTTHQSHNLNCNNSTSSSFLPGTQMTELTSSGSSSWRSSELASPHHTHDSDGNLFLETQRSTPPDIVISVSRRSASPTHETTTTPTTSSNPNSNRPTPRTTTKADDHHRDEDDSDTSNTDCLSSPTAMANALKQKLAFAMSSRRESVTLSSQTGTTGDTMLRALQDSIFDDIDRHSPH